ncbi:transcriptional regulator [bacterium]|nr:transcriptional regulator [candidate division CSSED10-310 bacterium]
MSRGEQLSRQWQVLRVLENHRYGISIDELAEKLECSRRTLERDLKALQDMGFPIQSEAKEFGKKYWTLTKQFIESDNLILTPTEIISLYLANQFINPLAGTYLDDGWKQFLGKIQSLLPPTVLRYFSELDETLYVKPLQESAPVPSEYLEKVRKAINESVILKIEHKKPDNQTSSVTLHPYGLIVYENSFYVMGYCEERDDIRTFKLQRITKVSLTRKKYEKPKDFSLEKCFKGSFGIIENMEIAPKTIRCEMTDWAARMVREQKWHRTQVIEKDDGDTIVVSFLLDSSVEFKRWILGFGPLARIIEPKEVQQEVVQSLAKMLKNYKQARND